MINPNFINKKTWAITTFYNPEQYKNKIANYKIFRKNLESQNIPLITIECAFGGKAFELNDTDANILVQVRSSSVLWQKERLLNIALKHLPKECHNIVWVDADIIFLNNNWLLETEKLLEQYSIVQPFAKTLRLNKFQTIKDVIDRGIPESQFKDGFAYFFNKNRGEINYGYDGGFAWASKKSIFDACGFYDLAIIGGADWIMNQAYLGIKNKDYFSESYSKKLREYTKGGIYFTEGNIVHLYHGSIKNRLYGWRQNILLRNNFNPNVDLLLNNDECWEWSPSASPLLKKEVKDYFKLRNENSSILNYVTYFFTGPIIGKIGIFIKNISPKLYYFLKNKLSI